MTWCSSSQNRKKTKSNKPMEFNDVLNPVLFTNNR